MSPARFCSMVAFAALLAAPAAGGGWPGTFLDVASGVDHVFELAGDYPLDLDRVIAAGHSAGAASYGYRYASCRGNWRPGS